MAGASGKMSKSRATGLAKVSMVIEWLASALGGAGAQAGCAPDCAVPMISLKNLEPIEPKTLKILRLKSPLPCHLRRPLRCV